MLENNNFVITYTYQQCLFEASMEWKENSRLLTVYVGDTVRTIGCV